MMRESEDIQVHEGHDTDLCFHKLISFSALITRQYFKILNSPVKISIAIDRYTFTYKIKYQLVKRLTTSFLFLLRVPRKTFHSAGMLPLSVSSSQSPLQLAIFLYSLFSLMKKSHKGGKGIRWRFRSCSPKNDARFKVSSHEI